MKISFGTTTIAGGKEASQEPFDVQLRTLNQVQVASFLRADSVKTFDRGNRSTSFSFKVIRRHETVLAASEFLLSHATSLHSLSTTLTIALEDAESTTYQLPYATLVSVQSEQKGNTTTHRYEIMGGLLEAVTE